jgi:hypothetical protein
MIRMHALSTNVTTVLVAYIPLLRAMTSANVLWIHATPPLDVFSEIFLVTITMLALQTHAMLLLVVLMLPFLVMMETIVHLIPVIRF